MKHRVRIIAACAALLLLGGVGEAAASPATPASVDTVLADGPPWFCARVIGTSIGFCIPGL